MRFKGIVTIDDASTPQNRARSLEELLIRDAPVTSEDAPVSEIIPKSVEARFPFAVVDGQGRLKGLVTKASALSSLI